MGGLRKPQECVLHYYKTKKDTNYKQLLIDKNKRRKINAVRRRKEKEREKDNSRASVDESGQEFTELTETNKSSLSEKEKTVDETEDEDLDQKELTNDIEISSPKDVPEAPAEVEDFNPVKEEAQENVHPKMCIRDSSSTSEQRCNTALVREYSELAPNCSLSGTRESVTRLILFCFTGDPGGVTSPYARLAVLGSSNTSKLERFLLPRITLSNIYPGYQYD